MAKKNKKSRLKSFDDVDRSLCEISVYEARLSDLQSDYARRIAKIQESFEIEHGAERNRLQMEAERLRAEIELFVRSNLDQFPRGNRTRSFEHGQVSVKFNSPAVQIGKTVTEEQVIEKLRAMRLKHFIRENPTLNRERIKDAFGDRSLSRMKKLVEKLKVCGIFVRQTEKITIRPYNSTEDGE